MSDPLVDLERRVDSLASRIDLTDQRNVNDITALKADAERIRLETVPMSRFQPLERLFWAETTAVIVALIGGAVAIVTRTS